MVVSIGPAGEVLRINLAYRHVQAGVSTAFSTGAYGLHRPARCGTHVLEPGRVVAEFSPRPLSGVFRPSPSTRTSPGDDWPETAHVAGGLARVAAVLDRIASDAEDLARARRAGELPTAAVLPGRLAERRRLAEPDLDFGTFCRTGRMPAPRRRGWNEPGMRGRPSGTAAGRPGSSPPAPAAHSTGADDPCQEL